MSQTISFVASDELAEYLENEAERRYTTVSSTAQMLLAEKVREEQDKDSGVETDKPASAGDSATEGDVFERYPDAWYRPNSEKNNYAVTVPESVDRYDSGEQRYYKTAQGARQALRRWYE